MMATIKMIYIAMGFRAFKLSINEGDCENGIYPVGQVTGLINDVPTVDELIKRMAKEARQAQAKLTESVK